MVSENTTDLKLHISRASDALRSVLSAGEYKYYVLPVIFLALLPTFLARNIHPNDHEVPTNSVQSSIRHLLEEIDFLFESLNFHDLGYRTNQALHLVENCFPDKLGEVFRGFDFCSNLLGKTSQREGILKTIFESFAYLRFCERNIDGSIESPATIFNSAIGILATQARDQGEYITPPEISTLIGRLVAVREGREFYDPACGSGSLLSICTRESQLLNSNIVAVGQERSGAAWSLAKMNLFFAELRDSTVILGDSLRFPLQNDDGTLQRFDVAVSNPPWNLRDWGYEFAKSDRHGRFDLGLPLKFSSDYAFILHMLAVLRRPSGQLAVIVPNGTLSKSGNDGTIRRELIEQNLVDAVIALPPKIFFNTSIPANILILKFGRTDTDVFFVDASNEYVPLKNRHQFSELAVQRIAGLYATRSDYQDFSLSVGFDELHRNDFDLSVSRYIQKAVTEDSINLKALRKRRRNIQEEIVRLTRQIEDVIVDAERVN